MTHAPQHSPGPANVSAFLLDVGRIATGAVEELHALRRNVRWKSDGSPVTDADLSMQSRIVEAVQNRLGRSARVISEEMDNTWDGTIDTDFTVVIDPIDGTENFVSGFPEWGVSVGVWDENGRTVGATILLPEMGLSLTTGDRIEPARSRIVGFSSSNCEAMDGLWRSAGERRVLGCAVLNLYNVATGRFRTFLNPCGAKIWDLLPGCVLALEQGCDVIVDGVAYDGGLRPVDSKLTVELHAANAQNTGPPDNETDHRIERGNA